MEWSQQGKCTQFVKVWRVERIAFDTHVGSFNISNLTMYPNRLVCEKIQKSNSIILQDTMCTVFISYNMWFTITCGGSDKQLSMLSHVSTHVCEREREKWL